MEKMIKTLGDLKDALNTLQDFQLKMPAIVQGLDEPGWNIASLVITEEPEVLTEEGYVSLSDWESSKEEGDEILGTRLPGYVYLFNQDFYEE